MDGQQTFDDESGYPAASVDPAEEWMRRTYGRSAEAYRQHDEIDVQGEDHRYICSRLRQLTARQPEQSSVLDVGCGAGRFFYCLRNVRRLVGIDVCPEMLEQARIPVRSDRMATNNVELICGNVHSTDFPDATFDLIYSMGVFGNGCRLTAPLCSKFFKWLKDGGKLFFDTFDLSHLPVTARVRETLRGHVQDALPKPVRSMWLRRCQWPPFFYTSLRGIQRLLESARFVDVDIVSKSCQLVEERGRKFYCLATKPGGAPA